MTRSLLALAQIFLVETISVGWGCLAMRQTISSAAWEHNRMWGRQEMNPTANGDVSPQIKQPSEDAEGEMWELTGLWMVCMLGEGASHSWSQVEKKLDRRCPLTNGIPQAWKRYLGNCRQIVLLRNKTTPLLWTVVSITSFSLEQVLDLEGHSQEILFLPLWCTTLSSAMTQRPSATVPSVASFCLNLHGWHQERNITSLCNGYICFSKNVF